MYTYSIVKIKVFTTSWCFLAIKFFLENITDRFEQKYAFQKQVVEVEHLHSPWTRCSLQGPFSFVRYWGSSDKPNCHSEHCSFCDQSTSKCPFFLFPENHNNVTLSCCIFYEIWWRQTFFLISWCHNFNSRCKNIRIIQQEHGCGFNGLA